MTNVTYNQAAKAINNLRDNSEGWYTRITRDASNEAFVFSGYIEQRLRDGADKVALQAEVNAALPALQNIVKSEYIKMLDSQAAKATEQYDIPTQEMYSATDAFAVWCTDFSIYFR
jgi:hypothetical protein